MPVEETLIGQLRREYQPAFPPVLQDLSNLNFEPFGGATSSENAAEIQSMFPNTYGQPILNCVEQKVDCEPLRYGVVLSGGQAAGGHNVITGLFDALKEMNPESVLIGFLKGPGGIMKNESMELTAEIIDAYRNTGGFDMIMSGRDKIQTEEQMASALNAMQENNLDGLVVIGGDDSNTNAAVLAEYFQSNGSKTRVVGIPKTIDGDLQNEYIEMSFGFDTAVKTYSQMISNIARDSQSAAKAWHFIKLMGRDASHVTLDCAIQTRPNVALIGEEIQSENMLLRDVNNQICDIICDRAANGQNYGVCLIPEGVIGFIPSMKTLIHNLNEMLKEGSEHLAAVEAMPELSDKVAYVREQLAQMSSTTLGNFDVLPRDIQAQLLLERDPHGNVQISQVPTESLFIQIVQRELKKRKETGRYVGKFRGIGHFFGYDGRSGFPSNFDCNYCYSLGRVGALLIARGYNGYMARVYDLEKMPNEWKAGAIPITMLMNMEVRHGEPKPVIKKALVNVERGRKFWYYAKRRYEWGVNDSYRQLGPIQFFGPPELTDSPPMNVLLKKTGDVVWPVPSADAADENAATSG